MKKILALFLSLLLLCTSFTGCKVPETASPTASQKIPETTSPAVSQAPQTASPENSPSPTPAEPSASPSWDGNSPLGFVQQWLDGSWHALLLGEIKNHAIQSFDPSNILIDGKPLSDEVRSSLRYNADGSPLYTTSLPYAEVGQLLQLYDMASGSHTGSGKLTSLDYIFEQSSGSDLVTAGIDLKETPGNSDYLAVSGTFNMRPREVKELSVEGGDGMLYVLQADIDGDGSLETVSWEKVSQGNDPNTHTISISRDNTLLCSLDFWYDYDFANPDDNAYSIPNPPALLDINGDGVYELILQTHGHNSSVHIYAWENNAFHDTGVGYYSGD